MARQTALAAVTSPAAARTVHEPDQGGVGSTTSVEPGLRSAMIAEAAYFHAERRGFEPGHELEDWVLAECEIDGRLAGGVPSPTTAPERR